MSRTAWKSFWPASLAAITLLGGCNPPLFARRMSRPAPSPAAVAAAPPLPAAAELPAGAGALGPSPWPEPSGLIYSAPALPPMPDLHLAVRNAHATTSRAASVQHYARPAHQPAPEPPRVTHVGPERLVAPPAATPVRAQAQAARPLGEAPTLIAPVAPPPPSLPDPPAARPQASAADAAKPARLAPAAPARPAALAPVHKAQPGADTTPY